MSKIPTRERLTSLEEVLKVLGDPERIGRDITYCAKGYSVKDLILDLQATHADVTRMDRD